MEINGMWVLYVMSSLHAPIEGDITKVSRYAEYKTQQECSINKAILNATFVNNEVASCIVTRTYSSFIDNKLLGKETKQYE